MKYDDILNKEGNDNSMLSEPVMATIVSTAPALNMENVWCFLNSLDNANKRIIANRLLGQIDNIQTVCGLSDSDLETELSSFPSLDEASFPELTDEDFHLMVKNMAHKPMKGIEKWL